VSPADQDAPAVLVDRKGRRVLAGQSQWSIAWRTLRRNPTAIAGLVGLGLLIAAAVLAPWLAPFEPTKLDYMHPLEAPGAIHWFGTDDLGRDILSRVIWGGRESLRVGLLAVFLALVGGLSVGLLSGYSGGAVDTLIQRIIDVFMAFPNILLMIAIVSILGPGLGTVMIALGLSSIPSYSRLVRGCVLSSKNLEYVTAARVVGAGDGRIMLRHILPNVTAPVIVYSTVSLGSFILVTAGLSYLGLGAQPPSPEWGSMLNAGRQFLYNAQWMSLFPGLAIFVAVLCVNLLGDGLRDALDPKLRR
jgi:peptide/nickel transport system permease protein